MNIQDKLTHYKKAVYLSRSPNTARAYGIGLNHLARFIESEGVDTLNDESNFRIEHFIGFPAYLMQRGYSRDTLVNIAAKASL